jgi:hypothetical protein
MPDLGSDISFGRHQPPLGIGADWRLHFVHVLHVCECWLGRGGARSSKKSCIGSSMAAACLYRQTLRRKRYAIGAPLL